MRCGRPPKETPSCCRTAPTQMCSPWPPTRSRWRFRSSTCGLDESAANVAGLPTAPTTRRSTNWSRVSWSASMQMSRASRPTPAAPSQPRSSSSRHFPRVRSWNSCSANSEVAGFGCMCRSGVPNGSCSTPWPATPPRRWRCTRPSGRPTWALVVVPWKSCSSHSPWRPRRCASRASTSATCRAPRWLGRWWSSKTGWPANRSTGGS